MPPTQSPTEAAPVRVDQDAVRHANATGRRPVVFVHGLWLLASSWDRWARAFEDAGYAAVPLRWPGEPETVADANARPEAIAGLTVGRIAAHLEERLSGLDRRPVLVGHSFGGLLVQLLAGRGLSDATVAIDPAPFRGVLPLPVSSLRAARPVLGNPLNRGRAVALTEAQWRYAFANAVSEDEARALHARFAVPAPGAPLFQAAAANLNPFTELKVDTKAADRGPLLLLSGERDHTVPWALTNAAFKRQRRNPGVTEITEVPGRGHALTIDDGWREVADLALGFLRTHAAP